MGEGSGTGDNSVDFHPEVQGSYQMRGGGAPHHPLMWKHGKSCGMTDLGVIFVALLYLIHGHPGNPPQSAMESQRTQLVWFDGPCQTIRESPVGIPCNDQQFIFGFPQSPFESYRGYVFELLLFHCLLVIFCEEESASHPPLAVARGPQVSWGPRDRFRQDRFRTKHSPSS